MEFTKEQINLLSSFYNALEMQQNDLEQKEILKQKLIELKNQIEEIEKKVLTQNTIITSTLKGIILEKENTPSVNKLFIQGGNQMKFQGITITKNKSCNTWYARYRNNGKQFYISAKTQQLCYNKLKEALKQKSKDEIKAVKQNSNKVKTKNQLTLIEWYKKWLELYKSNVKQTTLNQYNVVMKHIQDIVNKPLNKITSIQILEQLNKISGSRTKQKVYELIKSIFDKAIANEIIIKNPLLNIDKPKHKRKIGNALTSKDEKELEKLLIENNADMFLICLYQGLRRGEALALTGKDINLQNNLLTINKALNPNNKIDTTKNEYSNRVMPIFNKSIPILKKYADMGEKRIFTYTYKSCEDVFNTITNQLNGNYKIHSLRHTFITRCQENNIPLHIIQKWVGHNIGSNVTSQVYTHTRELAEAENVLKYNQIFN